MHTEEQARGLWCPMVRAGVVRGGGGGPLAPGCGGNYLESNCIASKCAMWRQQPDGKGYCGLAGLPDAARWDIQSNDPVEGHVEKPVINGAAERICSWALITDHPYQGQFSTECGGILEAREYGKSNVNFEFCPSCGGRIQEVPTDLELGISAVAETASDEALMQVKEGHTKEPWLIGRAGSIVADEPVHGVSGSDSVEYYGGHLVAESLTPENARRIIACVNACAHISTESLESGLQQNLVMRAIEAEEQRDELISAVTDALEGQPIGNAGTRDENGLRRFPDIKWITKRLADGLDKAGGAA